MDARVSWTITAVALVGILIGARFYVGMMLEEGTAPAEAVRVDIPSRPPPVKPARKPDPLDSLTDLAGVVYSLGEASDEEEEGTATLATAHRALSDMAALDIPWTPELAARANTQMAQLENSLSEISAADAPLAAHVLATRVAVAEKSGAPDADASARLAALRASNPQDFNWE